jgi:hypothetical protein
LKPYTGNDEFPWQISAYSAFPSGNQLETLSKNNLHYPPS